MAKDKNPGFLDLLAGGKRQPKRPSGPDMSLLSTPPAQGAGAPNTQRVGNAPDASTELSAVVEQQSGLLERVLTEGSDDPAEARTDLATLNGILTRLSQKTVVVIFAMGKILAQVKATLPHGDFIPWVEENCPFAIRSARNYMQIYERYKDEPRLALEELSISEAYIEAGIKRLGAPEVEERGKIAGDPLSDGLPKMDEMKSIFRTPPASGIPLKRYRVVTWKDGKIYAVSPELGLMAPVVNLFVNQSIAQEEYQMAVDQAHKDVCMALEAFYYRLEQLEDQGSIARPFDTRMGAMMRASRGLPIPKKEKKPARKGRKP